MTNTTANQAEHFSQWLSARLRARGWSQAELANRLGKDRGVVGNWFRGQRVPSPESCDLIADAFGLDLDTVLFHAGHRPAITDVDPSSREAEVLGLVHRIDWEREGESVEMVVDMLQVLAHRLPKRSTD